MTFAQCQGCASPACIVNGECCFPKEETTPIAWGLLNPVTGELGPNLYVSEDMARVGATAMTNRWRTLTVVPLFLGGEGNGSRSQPCADAGTHIPRSPDNHSQPGEE